MISNIKGVLRFGEIQQKLGPMNLPVLGCGVFPEVLCGLGKTQSMRWPSGPRPGVCQWLGLGERPG